MRTILTLATVFFFSLAVPFSTNAASPSVSLSVPANRRFIFVTFSNTKNVARVSYTVTYDTPKGQRGFEGGFRSYTRANRFVRRQILGTCSSGKCVYHASPKNFVVDATFTLKNGQILTSQARLR